jgi:hypothetical protein
MDPAPHSERAKKRPLYHLSRTAAEPDTKDSIFFPLYHFNTLGRSPFFCFFRRPAWALPTAKQTGMISGKQPPPAE